MGLTVALDGSHCTAQFFPKLSVARVGERAEPLRGMRLRDGRAGTDDLPALAPGVAGSTHLTQPPLGCRQLRGLWQGTLAGGLARAINVEDDSLSACSINKSACLPLFTQRARQPIFKKERTQGFDRRLGEAGKKATKRRACWQLLSCEESHEASGKGLQALVEGFERPFTTDGVAEEHRDKVDDLIAPEAATGKTHALTDGIEDALPAKMLDDEGDFAQPTGGRGNRSRSGLDTDRRISDTGHWASFSKESCFLPSYGGTVLGLPATC